MELIEEDAAALIDKRNWFPPEIENDPWVVYHATSSVTEEQIDRDGFQCGSVDLNRVVLLCLNIIETTDWWEDAATATLKAYSFPRIGGEAPFFCALYPQRCCLYTRREFAGGETAYALRRIIPKLVQDALENPGFFEDRFESFRQQCIYEAQKGVPTHRKVLKVNLEWLREKAAKLQSFLPDLLDIRDRHRYGVIYALKLDCGDVTSARYDWSDGLRVYKPLPAAKCIAKLLVHGEHELSSASNDSWHMQNHWRDDGELARLVSKSGCVGGAQDDIDESQLVDPQGAEDLRFQIMIDHGNDVLRKFAISQRDVQREILMSKPRIFG